MPKTRAATALGAVTAVAGALVVQVLLATPASAHDELLSTDPAAGSTVATVPETVVLTFAEPPLSLGMGVDVSGPSGSVSLGAPMVDGSTVRQMLQAGAPAGTYTVRWRVTADDGHPVTGSFTFVASAPGAVASPVVGQREPRRDARVDVDERRPRHALAPAVVGDRRRRRRPRRGSGHPGGVTPPRRRGAGLGMTNRYARLAALAVPIAVVVALGALVLGGQLEQAQPGLPDAGAFVRVGLPVGRALQDLAAALTVGLLVLAAFVLPPSKPELADELVGHRARAVRFAAVASTCWLVVGTVTLVLTYADVAGLSPTSPDFTSQLGYFLRSFDLGRSLVASLVLAALVSIGTMLATRTTTVGWLALGPWWRCCRWRCPGTRPAPTTTRPRSTASACTWSACPCGSAASAALVLLSPWVTTTLPVSVRRYSTLAGWCFAFVAASGVLNAWLRLGSLAGLATEYGALVVVKTPRSSRSAPPAGGTAGRRSRGWTPGPSARRDFWRLATVEVLVMAATIGVAVALSRSAPPVSQTSLPEGADAATGLLGYPIPPPLTGMRWIGTWYVEPAWATVAVLAAAVVPAVVPAHARREATAGRRTGSCCGWSGASMLLWATSGAPGVYGRTEFSLHMVQHMTLMMVVPMLLVGSAPVTLALRTLRTRDDGSRGPREWLLAVVHSRALPVLANPVVAAGLFIGSLFVFYYSPLFGWRCRRTPGTC